ncbi:hypothetical protein AVEN_209961-1 [Araneus ventricosus]|uniref:Uncharacterized protein n=1 Tax=Araneus ventricosus TaxID=182803 RepID=A0A4Y2DB94_ARAVE|nr:hypothetical protein AVEN_209961-1 [Araneus ventricosus]
MHICSANVQQVVSQFRYKGAPLVEYSSNLSSFIMCTSVSFLSYRTFNRYSFTDIDTFVVPRNQFQETILVKIGAHRLKEVLHSLNASVMSVFAGDDPIVLTSMQEKGESLIGQDRGARPGDPISPILGDECVLL